MNKRTQHPPEFKTKVVLEVLAEEQTVHQIAAKYSVNPVVISRWKKESLERAPEIFRKGPSVAEKTLALREDHIAELERKVGQLTYEVDWMKKNLLQSSNPTGRKRNVDFTNKKINISRQAELLSINRSSIYRKPPEQKAVSAYSGASDK